MQDPWAYKNSNNCRNRSKGLRLQGDFLPKSGNFYHLGRVPTPVNRSACVANPTYVPLGHAKFHMDQCSESPLRGENADF